MSVLFKARLCLVSSDAWQKRKGQCFVQGPFGLYGRKERDSVPNKTQIISVLIIEGAPSFTFCKASALRLEFKAVQLLDVNVLFKAHFS